MNLFKVHSYSGNIKASKDLYSFNNCEDLNIKNSSKFELAAELVTEGKRNSYLSDIFTLKLNNKQLIDSIDTLKLAEEVNSSDLLLSEKWQQGYECYKNRSQKKTNEILVHILTSAMTKLSAAASLDFGGYIIDHLKDHSLLTEDDSIQLIKELTEQANDFNAKELSMYDPEMHPDLGEFVEDGKDRLYYWSKDNLEKYP